MDVLSELLQTVRLNGALFYNAEFTSPWSFRSPPSQMLGPYIGHESDQVIIYHLVTDGRAWCRPEGGEQVTLEAGDIVVFPHGDPHMMGNGAYASPIDVASALQQILTAGLDVSRHGGGGEPTRFVCGYMTCDPQLCRMLVSGLPRMIIVNIRNDESGVWLENTIRFSVAQAPLAAPGLEAVLSKLSEALFAEIIRRYVASIPPTEQGWLAGARDAEVGRALALLHSRTAEAWTIGKLAEEVGTSRSVLAERFRFYLGEPPITYLTRWRLQMGARMLKSTNLSVAEVAGKVGYESEAAFNRAFKREFGEPPASFRRSSKAKTAAVTR